MNSSAGRADIQLIPWLNTPRGRLLLQRERAQMRKVLPHLFGYRLLQIGAWGGNDGLDRKLLETSATLCQWVIGSPGENPSGRSDECDLVFDGESLPVSSRCVDAVVLPHSLERVPSPHRLLREVDRVLCDHGHIVVLGFNPLSLWSVRQRLGRRPLAAAGRHNFYSLGRMCDWLELLDYELLSASRFGVGFPYLPAEGVDIASAGWWRLPGIAGQAYSVVARKRVLPVTPKRSTSKAAKSVPARGLPEPTACVGRRRREAA